MLLRGSGFNKSLRTCLCIIQPMSSTAKADLPPLAEALKRGPDQRDISQMDLLEERIKRRTETRELNIGGVAQKWNYRSEIVNKHGLDNNHRYIWLTYSAIILFGFGAFVWVKSNVVMGRQEEMKAREEIRKSLKLSGTDRKKIGVIEE
ncbi:unnamed protein product, partial [Mesorhabditis belari]|uniref:Uncharacterized protein n=1 Tax=Mesorhabditis belari TaxID=2138241 RepID=A0AAF3FCU2_9BILA